MNRVWAMMGSMRALLPFFCWFGCALTQSAFAQPCTPLLANAQASLFRCGKVQLLRLQGEPIARARAYGALLKGPLSPEPVRYFSGKVQDTAAEGNHLAARLATLAYNPLVRLLFLGAPVSLQEEIDAQAAGMGADSIVLRRALALPDTVALTNAWASLPGLRFLPNAGCTSVALRPGKGGLLVGRNLDFAGVGLWDRLPLLTFIDPPAGSPELKHLVLGTDGLLTGGITGVNEAGITLALHQNYSRDGGIRGVPVALVGEIVLRGAHNLGEAEELLRRNRPPALWTFVLTDLRSGQAEAVEVSPSRFLVRPMEGRVFVQTNHALHSESRADEMAGLAVEFNSIHRMKHAFELLEKSAPSPASLAQALSYQEDSEGQLSAYHDVLKALTVQTAIFESRPGASPRLYLGADSAPVASGTYAGFDLGALWNPSSPPAFDEIDLLHTPTAKRDRQKEIAHAFRTAFDEHDPAAAARLLAAHHTLDAALFRAVAAYQDGRFGAAASLAQDAALEPRFVSAPAYILQSLQWVRLAALLRLDRRPEAGALAASLLAREPANPRLRELCELVVRGKTPPWWMLKLEFDFFSGDINARNS